MVEIETEDTAIAAALPATAPWSTRYDSATAKAVYWNPITSIQVWDLGGVARADLLEDTLDPPPPWVKEVGSSWLDTGDVSRDLLEDTPAGPRPLMSWYRNPVSGAKVLELVDVYELDGIENAPDPGPDWQKQWDPSTQSVQFIRVGTNSIVGSIDAVRALEALEVAPEAGPGWAKAWDTVSWPPPRNGSRMLMLHAV